MAVMRERFSAWPETVAYKRMIRTLVRGQQYVPPQQPTGQPPPALAAAVAEDDQAAEFLPLSNSAWTLGQNADGDLVARHSSGLQVTLAANPEPGL